MVRPAKTPAQRRRLIARWRTSGMPLARFARLHHVHPRTLWGWVHHASNAEAPAPTFIPVQVVDRPAEDVPARDLGTSIEIILPTGTRLRVAVGT